MKETKFIEKARKGIMHVSFQERRKRELGRYLEEREKIRKMRGLELEYEHVCLKALHEQGKSLLAVVSFGAIFVMASVWKFWGECAGNAVRYAMSCQGAGTEAVKIGIIVCTILAVSLTVFLFGSLILYMKERRRIYK